MNGSLSLVAICLFGISCYFLCCAAAPLDVVSQRGLTGARLLLEARERLSTVLNDSATSDSTSNQWWNDALNTSEPERTREVDFICYHLAFMDMVNTVNTTAVSTYLPTAHQHLCKIWVSMHV